MRRTAFVSRGAITPKPGRCKHCRKRLERIGEKIHPDCVGPWWEANQGKVRTMAAKADRVATKKKLRDMEGIPELKKRAQKDFNEYIRERDKDKGCFVCDKPFPATNTLGGVMDAGHVITRGHADHLRFNEDNVHGECKHCNASNGAKPHQIKAGAIRRIGQERFDALESNHAVHKWTREELIEIAATSRAKTKALREQQENT